MFSLTNTLKDLSLSQATLPTSIASELKLLEVLNVKDIVLDTDTFSLQQLRTVITWRWHYLHEHRMLYASTSSHPILTMLLAHHERFPIEQLRFGDHNLVAADIALLLTHHHITALTITVGCTLNSIQRILERFSLEKISIDYVTLDTFEQTLCWLAAGSTLKTLAASVRSEGDKPVTAKSRALLQLTALEEFSISQIYYDFKGLWGILTQMTDVRRVTLPINLSLLSGEQLRFGRMEHYGCRSMLGWPQPQVDTATKGEVIAAANQALLQIYSQMNPRWWKKLVLACTPNEEELPIFLHLLTSQKAPFELRINVAFDTASIAQLPLAVEKLELWYAGDVMSSTAPRAILQTIYSNWKHICYIACPLWAIDARSGLLEVRSSGLLDPSCLREVIDASTPRFRFYSLSLTLADTIDVVAKVKELFPLLPHIDKLHLSVSDVSLELLKFFEKGLPVNLRELHVSMVRCKAMAKMDKLKQVVNGKASLREVTIQCVEGWDKKFLGDYFDDCARPRLKLSLLPDPLK